MTGFEIFIAVAIVVGFVAKLVAPIWDSNKHKIKNDLLRDIIDGAVRAGEEIELSKQLGGKTKQKWVVDLIVKQYPEYEDNLNDLQPMIDAAVQAAGLGATGKALAGKPPIK